MAHYMIHNLEEVLNTTDKRYIFLKIFFPHSLPFINIEGSPRETSLRIVEWFIENDLIFKLEDKFFKYFKQ